MNDKEVISTLGIARNTYYKYIREIKGVINLRIYGVLRIQNNIPSIIEILEEDELERFAGGRTVVELEEMSENDRKVYNFKYNNINYQYIVDIDGSLTLRA